MKMSLIKIAAICTLLVCSVSCSRSVRTATDVTPGNVNEKLDWRYGAGDIRIQTTKITGQLFDRWYQKTGYQCDQGKPRIIINEIDNCTDRYISTDMIRDIFEGVAINDGRFTVVVGNANDECQLDYMMGKIQNAPKYNNSTRLETGKAIAPEFLGKIRITKAIRSERFYDFEDYRMTVTLYDIETQQAIDSAWDVLCKQVRR
ncbi:MAG: hypothetical protein H0W88_10565 [Parachlamydiaceae bacterium]|nr:hypothetical protein [Parachlamydiaceae bacterium]